MKKKLIFEKYEKNHSGFRWNCERHTRQWKKQIEIKRRYKEERGNLNVKIKL